VIVCYSYRDSSLGNVAWQIGVTALHWRKYGTEEWETDFDEWWTKEPTERFDYTFPNSVNTDPEHNPDIAYNYTNGDAYMAFSEFQNNGNDSYIKYRHYIRSTNEIFPTEFYAQNQNHNGYDPSIDVGHIYVGIPPTGNTFNMVALTYTSQYQGDHWGEHNGYHICATGWDTNPAFDDIDRISFSVRNPDQPFRWLDAGLSCVDVAPNGNDTDFATCTYTQVTGVDGFGLQTGIFVVNWFGLITDLDEHNPITDTETLTDDAMYSSIAVNAEVGGESWASVTYMAQRNDALNQDWWHPRYVSVRLDDWETSFNLPVNNMDQWIDGNYNLSDIPFQNPGISTAIMSGSGMYWAAWANCIEMEPPPTIITAAYGDTN